MFKEWSKRLYSSACNEKKCDCNLALEASSANPIQITMGTSRVEAKVLVVNKGLEGAYDARLRITSDKELPPLRVNNDPDPCERSTVRSGGDQNLVRSHNQLLTYITFKMGPRFKQLTSIISCCRLNIASNASFQRSTKAEARPSLSSLTNPTLPSLSQRN